jgi:hypothetical protein
MPTFKQTSKVLAQLTGLYVAAGFVPAHAYLDPGTGSLMIQGLIASIAAGATVAGLYWHKVKMFFRRGQASSDEGPAYARPDDAER